MVLHSEYHTYDPRPEYPLVVTANRYWDPESCTQDGYTLVLTHGTGFHKEQWEPTLKHLFALAKDSTAFPIREAWSIDCPNHGDAAVLNEQALMKGGYDLVFSWGEYGYALYLFLTQNKEIRFSERKVIAIGHSMGGVALSLTQTYPHPPIFEQLVLCEPMLAPTDIPQDDPAFGVKDFRTSAAERRRDIWASKKEAYEAFKSRKAYAVWDDEVLRIFAEYGLRELPTRFYPDKAGVTLKCAKLQETACYRDSVSTRRVYDYLPALYNKLPVHVVWGEINDGLHGEIKKLVTNANAGRRPTSVSRVAGAGHLIVQMAPKGLAGAIFLAVKQKTKITAKL